MSEMIHTRGIVLHKLRYAENSLIVRVYTEQLGLQSYLIKGVSGKKAGGKLAHLEPLALLDMVAYHRRGHNLQYVKEMLISHPYRLIPFDLERSSILLFMNEILFKVIREEEANPPLFAFIWENLLLLDEAQLWKRDFPVLFLIRLMPFLGLTPLDNHDKRKTCFSLTEGLFREPDASDPYQIPADLSSWLAMVLRLPEASYSLGNIPALLRRELLHTLIRYCQVHLSGMGEVKSHHVLAQVLASQA